MSGPGRPPLRRRGRPLTHTRSHTRATHTHAPGGESKTYPVRGRCASFPHLSNISKVVKEFREQEKVRASITLDRPGPPVGKPIQIQITSRDFSLGEDIIEQIKAELNSYKGVHSLETDLDGDNVRYRILIENELAVSEGVDPSSIARTIFSASTGIVADEILNSNEKVEIVLGLQEFKQNETENKTIYIIIQN